MFVLMTQVEIEGTVFQVYVLKRPGIEELLKAASKLYEIVIYTASLSKYADPLMDIIDPKNYASHRLFREHCSCYNNTFVKDLTLLGRDLNNVIIVDNSPNSYAFQPENALPIQTWIDDASDECLFKLIPILDILAHSEDVRNPLKLIVKDGAVDYDLALSALQSKKHNNEKKKMQVVVDSWTTINNSSQNNIQNVQMKKSESTKRIVPLAENALANPSVSQPARYRCATPSMFIDHLIGSRNIQDEQA